MINLPLEFYSWLLLKIRKDSRIRNLFIFFSSVAVANRKTNNIRTYAVELEKRYALDFQLPKNTHFTTMSIVFDFILQVLKP